ncbi:hypothetical protein [Streptomyces sp. NPDC017949]|uniref:hypothetical protein n=1 Tax=Streptomyces sp. NPDC017949 TaxID=3365020 RepID=UPI00378BE5D2
MAANAGAARGPCKRRKESLHDRHQGIDSGTVFSATKAPAVLRVGRLFEVTPVQGQPGAELLSFVSPSGAERGSDHSRRFLSERSGPAGTCGRRPARPGDAAAREVREGDDRVLLLPTPSAKTTRLATHLVQRVMNDGKKIELMMPLLLYGHR